MLKIKPAHFIFMYHRVNDGNHNIFSGLDIGILEKQIKALKRYFKFVTLSEFVGLINNSDKPLTVITFDDGYKNTFTNAFPILKKNNLPATVFLTTGVIDNDDIIWTDKLSMLKRTDAASLEKLKTELKNVPNSDKENRIKQWESCPGIDYKSIPEAEKMLSWDEVKIMAKEPNIEFGAHTVNHLILTKVNKEEAEKEIIDSKQKIETELSRKITAFCYPNGQAGDFNEAVIEILRENGFTCAVTTIEGKIKKDDNNFALKRISLGERPPHLVVLKIIKEVLKNV
ncbi:MAG: polysaccharide deacetylase family protein [Candidatus Omnitrophota bacterium]|nr:polysaccharide deacetylase family protein [Candidatus Omnitrophota bacterium]